MKQKRVAILMVLWVIVTIGGGLAAIMWGAPGGCPPNSNCGVGTYPEARECSRNQCDSYAESGYCVICIPYY